MHVEGLLGGGNPCVNCRSMVFLSLWELRDYGPSHFVGEEPEIQWP